MIPSATRITFAGSLGHELAARLDLPGGAVRAYALFAHCFTCSKDVIAARHIAAKLAALGIAVLRFDFTGLGSSQGEFENTTFSSNVEDLVRAADHLRARFAAPDVAHRPLARRRRDPRGRPPGPRGHRRGDDRSPVGRRPRAAAFQRGAGTDRARRHRQRDARRPHLRDPQGLRRGRKGASAERPHRQPAQSAARDARAD